MRTGITVAGAFTLGAISAITAIVVMAELNHRAQTRNMTRIHKAHLASWDDQADDR